MSNKKVRALAIASLLLALCICSQFFKNLSVYITGPIVNTCLIICVLTANLGYAVAMAVITPVTAFFISGSPIMAAIPIIIPCVMLGNVILVLAVFFLKRKPNAKAGLPLSIIVGAVLKACFMGLVISAIIIPALIPEAMLEKKAVFQMSFSLTQLIVALIGGALAYFIYLPLRRLDVFREM